MLTFTLRALNCRFRGTGPSTRLPRLPLSLSLPQPLQLQPSLDDSAWSRSQQQLASRLQQHFRAQQQLQQPMPMMMLSHQEQQQRRQLHWLQLLCWLNGHWDGYALPPALLCLEQLPLTI